MENTSEPLLLRLPSEIRLQIYSYLISDGSITIRQCNLLVGPYTVTWNLQQVSGLQRVCKLIADETRPLFALATKYLNLEHVNLSDDATLLIPQQFRTQITTLKIRDTLHNNFTDCKEIFPALKTIIMKGIGHGEGDFVLENELNGRLATLPHSYDSGVEGLEKGCQKQQLELCKGVNVFWQFKNTVFVEKQPYVIDEDIYIAAIRVSH
jgi:hypothetical protein